MPILFYTFSCSYVLQRVLENQIYQQMNFTNVLRSWRKLHHEELRIMQASSSPDISGIIISRKGTWMGHSSTHVIDQKCLQKFGLKS
jgi:hypothetical protein